MKTHQHGNGMTHQQVIRFSNRIAYSAQHNEELNSDYIKGWEMACKHFAHELRAELRYCEKINL